MNENTDTEITTEINEQDSESSSKTYTEAEVQALLQREGDRRVSSALKKQKEKYEKEKAEADKLREMDESQRREYEFEKRVKELEDREKEFNLTQNKLSASKVMVDRGLPINFVDYIVAEDAETMMENITTFEKQWKAAIADAVSARLASPVPKNSNTTQTGLTKEAFKKMTLAQQSEIYKSNPELYKQLSAH